jgi:hypothetical protein
VVGMDVASADGIIGCDSYEANRRGHKVLNVCHSLRLESIKLTLIRPELSSAPVFGGIAGIMAGERREDEDGCE